MSKDFFDGMDPAILTNFGDIMIYDNQYVEPLETEVTKAKLDIADNESRITTLEHQIPGGGGGTGAYLNLGGTPSRYPLASECVGDPGDSSGFMVMARPDGIYFYNPTTKQLIEPKKGGGTVALQGQFPDVYEDEHKLLHSGRATKSGVYLANYTDIGITEWTGSDKLCTVLVVSSEKEEQQTAFSSEGTAHRVFQEGVNTGVAWVHEKTGGGDVGVKKFIELSDTPGGYHPGKLVGYNLSGTALIPVEDRDEFLKLKDTPDSYTGSTKMGVTVKADGTGLDFSPYLTLNTLKPNFDKLDNDIAQNQTQINALGGRVGSLETTVNKGVSFTGLTDTPDSFAGSGGKVVSVKPDATGLQFSDLPPSLSMADVENKAKSLISAAGEDGSLVLDKKFLKSQVHETWGYAYHEGVAGSDFVVCRGAAYYDIYLPEIVAYNAPCNNKQVRVGFKTTLYNKSEGIRFIRLFTDQAFWIDGSEMASARTMGSGWAEELCAYQIGGRFVWVVIERRQTIAHDYPMLFTLDDKSVLDGLRNGNAHVHPNAMVRPSSVVTGASMSASQVVQSGTVIARSGTGDQTITMPAIVNASTTNVPVDAVKIGYDLTISSHNEAGTITLVFPDANQFWIKGTLSKTLTIPKTSWVRLIAVHTTGSNYVWAKVSGGNVT